MIVKGNTFFMSIATPLGFICCQLHNKNTKGVHCSIFMATVDTQMQHNVTIIYALPCYMSLQLSFLSLYLKCHSKHAMVMLISECFILRYTPKCSKCVEYSTFIFFFTHNWCENDKHCPI
jgi:hypothetical protein